MRSCRRCTLVSSSSQLRLALTLSESGTEADAPFVSQKGGVDAANATILSIVNAVNGIYEADLGLTNRVVVQRAWTGYADEQSLEQGIVEAIYPDE